ncbi:hypothetical protein [Microbulbifer hydrolyticus]|uniref:Uncharacterized protein n=1 Tax=Microbulbifer hydrolyticus TaxID=48074 RepID=A0A6P1TBE1_9GAMM|nr:hypothetical protein [Microbulbifer hydrolyticus]MBB5210638.1 hypothetical protein [Microbulbifer hydrolyticus]QHQ38900.1 hypothetical protein GTQ55_07815 [Microbulbifer hydrolyticus]
MDLMWTIENAGSPAGTTSEDSSERVIHSASLEVTSDEKMQQAIDACIDKACGLLENNIQDDSRYMLFGWNVDTSTLTIVVTDDEKEHDSRNVVQCQFTATDESLDPEDIHYWIKDCLTTCAPFLQYSLIAAFHQESRASCTLL